MGLEMKMVDNAQGFTYEIPINFQDDPSSAFASETIQTYRFGEKGKD